MTHVLGRGLLLVSILMFGFILGVVYSNHSASEGKETPGFILHDDQSEEKKEERGEKEEVSSPYKGFKLKESNDLKIDMEDGENIVIYDYDDDKVRKDLIQKEDLHRDLIDKQNYAIESKDNFFSEMGLKTADVFEGVFRKFLKIVE